MSSRGLFAAAGKLQVVVLCMCVAGYGNLWALFRNMSSYGCGFDWGEGYYVVAG